MYDKRPDNKYKRRSDKGKQDRRLDPKFSRIQCFGCDGYGHVKRDHPSVHKNYRFDRRQRREHLEKRLQNLQRKDPEELTLPIQNIFSYQHYQVQFKLVKILG